MEKLFETLVITGQVFEQPLGLFTGVINEFTEFKPEFICLATTFLDLTQNTNNKTM
jgi:hypothetical protein